MIYVSRQIKVNEGRARHDPRLGRGEVWQGLVMKARNTLQYVPGVSYCEVLEQSGAGLVRDIEFRGQRARERVTFRAPERITFLRLSGRVEGLIVEEITGPDDDLVVRASFALQLADVASDSLEAYEFRSSMELDYFKTVAPAVAAMRRIASAQR
ncbi:SRPBCC family protein [Variovorax sp. J31P179]|uniref:SRPBCC family protein n=1 Tax=Variovorax sp. J31P179 TaxID=3053508 RepID=UPI002576FF9A|nr:SRPBCC family protein [Variovorax sp. J31P179]MDM0084631.1 SRPBCC family protein [Variovorax sp. J31P179]